MSALFSEPPFKKNKDGNLEFDPLGTWEAEYIYDITKKTIDYLQNRLRLETQTLITIPDEQLNRTINLEFVIEGIERRIEWNLLKIDAIKEWYVSENIPLPGTPEYAKQREKMEEILEQVRQHIRKDLKTESSDISDYEKIKSIVIKARTANKTEARKYQKLIHFAVPKKQSRSAYLTNFKDEIEKGGEQFAIGGMIWYDNPKYQKKRGRPPST